MVHTLKILKKKKKKMMKNFLFSPYPVNMLRLKFFTCNFYSYYSCVNYFSSVAQWYPTL